MGIFIMAPYRLTSRPKTSKESITLWQMVRDVLVASMNKGQFPVALVAIVVCLIIWKMPPQDVSRLAFDIVDGFKTWYLGGWILSPVVVFGWFFHSRWQRKFFTQEINRISAERNKWQEKAGLPVRSSEI